MSSPKVLAFYLPQFHPTAENDGWWTKGFTEWTNVVRGTPLFEGHYQPHLPGELGFYDLRLPETRIAQAALAAEHGIDGFCYYHYWSLGRRMLERTFAEVLESGSPDFPFCLLWANETWSRRWYAGGDELLMPQLYSEEDDEAHVEFLVTAFADERYVRVAGRPMFIVYRLHEHPDPDGFAARLRRRCAEEGTGDPYLVHVDVFDNEIPGPESVGFDASTAFLPHGIGRMTPPAQAGVADDGRVYKALDYEVAANAYLDRTDPGWIHHHCVVPMWDNSSRKLDAGGAMVLTSPSVEVYGRWLEGAIRKEAARGEGGVVFINAWNEWAEGAHLEPDLAYGRAHLVATKAAIERARGPIAATDVGRPSAPVPMERLAYHLQARLAAMYTAESAAFALTDREVHRRTAELEAELADARAGELRLINLLNAVLETDRPKRMGIGSAVTSYLDLVTMLATEVPGARGAASLAALAHASETVLGAAVVGSLVSIGSGGGAAAVVLRAALEAYDRAGRRCYATDLGENLGPATDLMARLGIEDHWARLYAGSAEALVLGPAIDPGTMAPGIDVIALLRVGATDDVIVSGMLEDLLKRVDPKGVIVVDEATPATVARVEAARSTGVRVVVASPGVPGSRC